MNFHRNDSHSSYSGGYRGDNPRSNNGGGFNRDRDFRSPNRDNNYRDQRPERVERNDYSGQNNGRYGGNNYSDRNNNANQNSYNNHGSKNNNLSLNSKPSLQKPPELLKGQLRLLPIGGQCESGRNAWYFEQDSEIILIDAGLGFMPHGFKGGADCTLPNLTYLEENKDRIKALLISNSHEEYSGNLINFIQVLDLKEVYLPEILAKVYKQELALFPELKVNILEPNKTYKIGTSFEINPFTITFIGADSFSFLITTSNHRTFYTGPFKIDHMPSIRKGQTDIQNIANLVTEKGVDILISNSTNVESMGYTGSEASVNKKLIEVFEAAPGRVITLLNACATHRLASLIQSAIKAKRKICLLNETLQNWYKAAVECKYFDFPKELFITVKDLNKTTNKDILILIGTEENSLLKPFIDLSYKKHPDISLIEGDGIILSGNPPLGTSRLIANAVDQLFLQGVHVIGGREAGVHAQSYAAQEELKFMYNLTRPKYCLPAHGESRQLVLHSELLAHCGVETKNIIIVDNGSIVDFDSVQNKVEITGKVASQAVFFNRVKDSSLNTQSIEERRSLSEDGVMTIVLVINSLDKKLIAGPFINMFGNSFNTDTDWPRVKDLILSDVKQMVIKSLSQGQTDFVVLRRFAHDIISRRIREKYGMSMPVLSIVIQEVQVAISA